MKECAFIVKKRIYWINNSTDSLKTMQFREDDVCHLIRACETYQQQTGSEYMWDIYEDLIHKLNNYGEEYSESVFQCTVTK